MHSLLHTIHHQFAPPYAKTASHSSCFLILQSAAFCILPRSFRHSHIAIHLLQCDSMNQTVASTSFCT
jgi:hypothetical protein